MDEHKLKGKLIINPTPSENSTNIKGWPEFSVQTKTSSGGEAVYEVNMWMTRLLNLRRFQEVEIILRGRE